MAKVEEKMLLYQREITQDVNGHIKHMSYVGISMKFQWCLNLGHLR